MLRDGAWQIPPALFSFHHELSKPTLPCLIFLAPLLPSFFPTSLLPALYSVTTGSRSRLLTASLFSPNDHGFAKKAMQIFESRAKLIAFLLEKPSAGSPLRCIK
ncbi:MAG: hypothetical protein ACSHYC_08590 [Alphaproteobacteria bacterium]